MAMNNTQKNIATEFQAVAYAVVDLKDRMQLISSMYTAESMASLTDEDYAAIPELAHVTVVEMTAAKGAIDAIITTLGEFVAGTNAYKLMKILTSVPK